ncbi:uncharacterized protein K444DRAFT_620398 [Hyaloscypha bicolor E]|uniref:Thiamine pyrophosphate enzyme N-terminal TPP-binding domain-containing protein n=1 Tax=Hyaloscypha bicolor E TaxID=1095630 RepID=A0A2J6SKF4_9HELO|nr:uncharacterized protein K444DRAFT_620398 [Hyaloscypha bicolor E]PMD51258.1 hypothetical protein K444DRAFT_620398 [Hyaloscypha bicolor E]
MAHSTFTVGNYLAERLVQIGIRHHFVVPGDYNLILLDKLGGKLDLFGKPALIEVGCANELNCSMAAEGYAQANSAAACVVTYSVGALSAFNSTGSAYAENLPLILLSGLPILIIQANSISCTIYSGRAISHISSRWRRRSPAI